MTVHVDGTHGSGSRADGKGGKGGRMGYTTLSLSVLTALTGVAGAMRPEKEGQGAGWVMLHYHCPC